MLTNTPRPSYSKQDFVSDLGKAKRGQLLRYHTGLLMADRLYNSTVDLLANAVWAAYTAGTCDLLQRRRDTDCEYFAVKL